MNAEQGYGSIVVFSGPSGVGKSTILTALGRLDGDFMGTERHFSVSCTTRAKRDSEIDGMHYHFISEDDYDRYLSQDAFLEHAEVHGHRYGTLKTELDDVRLGKDILLDIDVQGMRQVRRNLASDPFLASRLISIFIMPPSLDVLEKRLRGRHTDSESDIQRRLSNATKEMEAWREYDYILINQDYHECATAMNAIITASHYRQSILTKESWNHDR